MFSFNTCCKDRNHAKWYKKEEKEYLFKIYVLRNRGGGYMRIKCYKPPINSYNFMRYLCASLTKIHKFIIDLQVVVEHIYSFKTENKDLQYMFEDIEFRKGINSVTSNDIAEGINNLQTFELVGKLNPKYEKLIIYLTDEEADSILEECDETVREAMARLAELF